MQGPHRLLIGLACIIGALGLALAIFSPTPLGEPGPDGVAAPSLNAMVVMAVAACVLVVLLQSMIPLSENLSLLAVRHFGVSYGPVRLWGSAAFILGTLGGGFAIQYFAPGAVPSLLGACGVLLAIAAMAAPRLTANGLAPSSATLPMSSVGEIAAQEVPVNRRARRWSGWRSLLADRRFVFFSLAVALVQASHAMLYAFGSVHWVRTGISPDIVGLLWTVGVLAEIGVFAVADRLRWAQSPGVWLAIGAVAGLVRWPLTALDPPLGALFGLQILHGLTFGATHLAAITYIARFVPAGLGATAQSAISALGSGAIMGLAMWFSGPLYTAYAGGAYVAMAVIAVIGLGIGVRAMGRSGN